MNTEKMLKITYEYSDDVFTTFGVYSYNQVFVEIINLDNKKNVIKRVSIDVEEYQFNNNEILKNIVLKELITKSAKINILDIEILGYIDNVFTELCHHHTKCEKYFNHKINGVIFDVDSRYEKLIMYGRASNHLGYVSDIKFLNDYKKYNNEN